MSLKSGIIFLKFLNLLIILSAYVIDVLPQISELDGESISISERLTAKKMRQKVHEAIKVQSRLYREKREKQKFERKMRETKTGDDFWNEVDEDSPEARFEMHLEAKKQKEKENEHTPMFKKEEYKELIFENIERIEIF